MLSRNLFCCSTVCFVVAPWEEQNELNGTADVRHWRSRWRLLGNLKRPLGPLRGSAPSRSQCPARSSASQHGTEILIESQQSPRVITNGSYQSWQLGRWSSRVGIALILATRMVASTNGQSSPLGGIISFGVNSGPVFRCLVLDCPAALRASRSPFGEIISFGPVCRLGLPSCAARRSESGFGAE
jgi:hypothetical protein